MKKLNKHDQQLVDSAIIALERGMNDEFSRILSELKSHGLLDYQKARPMDRTFLNAALSMRNLEASIRILDEGAQIDLVDFRAVSPLMKAACFSLQITNRLIDAGSNIDARDSFGQTVLFHCCESPFAGSDVLKALIRAGADVNAQDYSGRTPLHSAVFALNPEKVSVLLDAGADPTIAAKGSFGRPLDYIHSVQDTTKATEREMCIQLLVSTEKQAT